MICFVPTLEQIANRVIAGKTLHPQQRVQGSIRPQQRGVRKAPSPCHHRHQKGRQRLRRINGIGSLQMHWQMLDFVGGDCHSQTGDTHDP